MMNINIYILSCFFHYDGYYTPRLTALALYRKLGYPNVKVHAFNVNLLFKTDLNAV